jgi:hypothetical protein
VNCPPDLSIQCFASTNVSNTGMATASDACSTNIAISFRDIVVSDGCLSTISRIWTAIDECGNAGSCTQTISLVDSVVPNINCPADQVVTNAFAPGSKAVFYEVTAVDACDPLPGIVCTPPSGSLFVEGTTTVSCVASDVCGNSSTCSFVVVVVQLPFTDTDGDDVDDDLERALFTNLTAVAVGTDFDLDGQDDVDEIMAGTDPKDPNDLLEVVSQAPIAAQSLNWTTVPGKVYNVEYTLGLTPASWVPIALNVMGGSFVDPNPVRAASGQGFYRVVVVP